MNRGSRVMRTGRGPTGDGGVCRLTNAALSAQTGPTPENLENAPLLRQWLPVVDHNVVPCLLGTVHGHHQLADGERIRTSVLLALDTQGKWARTRGHWYRLEEGWPENAEPAGDRPNAFTRIRHDEAVSLATLFRAGILRAAGVGGPDDPDRP